MVPINVFSHDLQENHFANTKLDNVTVTNTGRPLIGRFMKWKDTTLENDLKTALLSNSTITPAAYISTISLISWSQNVPTWNKVENKIWDEAPYAVGAHCLVIMNFTFENCTV